MTPRREEGEPRSEPAGWRLLAQSLLAALVAGFAAIVGFLWHKEELHEEADKQFRNEVKAMETRQADDVARREDADRESVKERAELFRRVERLEDRRLKK